LYAATIILRDQDLAEVFRWMKANKE
jgi:hypothetical protein